MDSEIKHKFKFLVIGSCLISLLAAGVIGWVYKMSGIQSVIAVPEQNVSMAQPQSVATNGNLFAAEEEQREVYLQQQREEQLLAKRKAKKEQSHECQFWRLQQKQGKSPIANKKVDQYCVLQVEEPSPSL